MLRKINGIKGCTLILKVYSLKALELCLPNIICCIRHIIHHWLHIVLEKNILASIIRLTLYKRCIFEIWWLSLNSCNFKVLLTFFDFLIPLILWLLEKIVCSILLLIIYMLALLLEIRDRFCIHLKLLCLEGFLLLWSLLQLIFII